MSWIAREIAERGGEVSFRDFMELALYHPAHGYYSAANPRYGRGGDFLTAPTASTWYASVLGGWLRRLARRVAPAAFVDVASGDGSLLVALADDQAGRGAPGIRELVSVERSPAMRAVQQRRLAGRSEPPVSMVGDVAELGRLPAPVVVHACELFDSLPVHRVVMRDHGLRELRVAVDGDALAWREAAAGAELQRYFAGHGVRLEVGQLAEANLAARPLHRALLEVAGRDDGIAIIVDYGYEAQRLYDPRARRGGSLAAYRSHRLARDPFEAPGRCDLTAHVNWNDLRAAAAAAGWRELLLAPLAAFLVAAGLADELERRGLGVDAELDARTISERQEVKRLLDPDGMGSDLKVLIQGNGPLAAAAAELLQTPR